MIVRSRGGDVQLRSASAASGFPQRQAAGVAVTGEAVAGVPAFTAAARLAAWSVAMFRLAVWRGAGVDRERVERTWQARLFAAPPNPAQSTFGFLETIEESLGYRGNSYVWLTADAQARVVAWWALHPDQVAPGARGGKVVYRVRVEDGYVDPVGAGAGIYEVGPDTILHIRGFGHGGALVAPSPVERFRLTLGAAIAKVRYEAGLFERGALSGLVISFPERMGPDQAQQWRDVWDASYAGVDNAHRTKVIGGGAQVTPIQLSQEDAQYVESVNLSIEDAARIVGVPASLIGGGRLDKPVSPEHEHDRWWRFGLKPRLDRIQSAAAAHPSLFGPGARDYPAFDVGRAVQGDLRAEADRVRGLVQAGVLLPDEGRAELGYPPLPDGVGKIPQIVPVGGAPNPETAPIGAGDGIDEGQAGS